MFVHWGPASLKGAELSWSRAGERRERNETATAGIPAEEYDKLYQQFNPTLFDAAEWVRIAKDAGMKYIVFTAKHHDGFAMFDTKQGEYKITNSPFARDISAELAAACHIEGVRLGFYYSPPDWHHPDYLTHNHARYLRYMHGQVRELLSNYGQLDILWFDYSGGKNTPEMWDNATMMPMIRSLQPNVLLTKRAGWQGDYDTPEGHIGPFNMKEPWEACIPIGTQWGWKPDDHVLSTEECLHLLIGAAGADGNLLLNVGPMPDGRIEPSQAARLREMGAWLGKFGQSVYGTRGGPWMPGPGIVSTRRGKSVFVHVLKSKGNNIRLPAIEARVISARIMGGATIQAEQTSDALLLTLPERNPIDTVVELQLDRDAMSVAPIGWPARYAATASNVYENSPEYAPGKACDGGQGSRWATDNDVRQAWLEVDLGETRTIDGILLSEPLGPRIRGYEIQVRDGDTWRTILEGDRVGSNFDRRFQAVSTRYVRLNILDATVGPTISEIDLQYVSDE